jgi:hypothetical protein
MSALNALNKLNKLIPSDKKVDKKEQDRPEMPIPDNVREAFMRFVPARQIAEYVNERAELEQSLIKNEMIGVYAEVMWATGSRPKNPKIIANDDNNKEDMSGIFQVHENIKLVYPEGEESATVRLAKALVMAGFTKSKAEEIIEKEINNTPMTVVRPLNELAVGTPLEQSACNKVIALLTGEKTEPLTDEERSVTLKQIEITEVRDGFLQRAKTYCKDANQLKLLLKVFQPKHYVSHCKFGLSTTPENRLQRLATYGQELILGQKCE